MPYSFVAAAVVGAYAANRAGKAGELQADAARAALGSEEEARIAARERLDPFIEGASGAFKIQQDITGANGPEAQQAAYASFKESPGVQWQRDQGMRSVESTLAASGVGGGSRLKAISEFNQGLAMQDFGNNFNRLQQITGTGLSAAGALTGADINITGKMADSQMAIGAANAGAVTARANAFGSTVAALGNMYASGGG